MSDAAQLGRQLHAEMQRLWSKHDLHRHHTAVLQGFFEDMSDALLRVGRDQPVHQADHAEQHDPGAADHGWAAAFAKASGMPRK
jgi:hypothetical protein